MRLTPKQACMAVGGVLSMVLSATNAAATHDAIFQIYPTPASGDLTEQTTFAFDDTPFIYLHLPSPGFNAALAFWESPSSPQFFTSGFSTATQYWFSLDSGFDSSLNPTSWAGAREAGLWDVSGNYVYANGDTGGGSTSFTVTPEPASLALMLTGWLVLVGSASRKKHFLRS